jgi:hypothetical protein
VRSSKDQLRDTLTEKNFLCYIFFTVQHSWQVNLHTVNRTLPEKNKLEEVKKKKIFVDVARCRPSRPRFLCD